MTEMPPTPCSFAELCTTARRLPSPVTEEAAQVWRLWSAVRESTAALAGSSQLAAALGRAAEDEMRVCGLQERMGPWTRCHGLWEAFRTVVSEGMRNTKRADVVNIDGKVGVEDEIHGLLARHCAYTCDRDGGNCDRRQCWPSHREPRRRAQPRGTSDFLVNPVGGSIAVANSGIRISN